MLEIWAEVERQQFAKFPLDACHTEDRGRGQSREELSPCPGVGYRCSAVLGPWSCLVQSGIPTVRTSATTFSVLPAPLEQGPPETPDLRVSYLLTLGSCHLPV